VGDVLFEDGRGVLFAPGPSGSDKEVPTTLVLKHG
jgi:hypothetical protein